MPATHQPLSVEKLIERQVRSWELRLQQGKESERPGRGRCGVFYFGPYLLISRERGAGARAAAALITKRLNWPVFDREIVNEIAQRAKIRRQLIESLDERGQNALEEFIRDILERDAIAPSEYLYHLKEVLLTLGHQGEVIIVGRGAEHVLPRQFGLFVCMVAPIEARIERISRDLGMTPEAARAHIEQVDKEREKFIRSHFQRCPGIPTDYDIIINTGHLTPERAAEIMLTALQQKLGVSRSYTRAAVES